MTTPLSGDEMADRKGIIELTRVNDSLRSELERLRQENAALLQHLADATSTASGCGVPRPPALNLNKPVEATGRPDQRASLEQPLAQGTSPESDEKQAFLLALTDRLQLLDEPVEILRVAAEAIAAHLGLEATGFNEVFSDDETVLKIAANRSNATSEPLEGYFQLNDYGPGWGADLRAGKELFFKSERPDSELLKILPLAKESAGGFAAVPLLTEGRLRAWLYAADLRPREWTEGERQLLREVTRRGWFAAERARTLRALRDSENRMRTLADELPQIIWTNNGAGIANYFNRRWYEYSGLNYEQSYAEGWEAIVHPDDTPASKTQWRNALKAGVVFDTEYRLRGADGEYRWFLGRNVPMRDETGEINSWFGTATDIHELKTAQTRALQQEEQFRKAIEDAPIPVIMYAEDGAVLGLSRVWTHLTGYSIEEMPTFEAWLDPVNVFGAALIREQIKMVFSSGGGTKQIELEIITRGSERRHWIFNLSAPGTLRNGRRFAVGMALDVTDRRKTEEALIASQELLHLIVESAHEHAIVATDLDRRITSWNSGAKRMTGYTEKETIGLPADIIFTLEDRQRGAPEREKQLALAEGRAADERWHLRKDGTRFWGSGVMLPMRAHPEGKTVGFVKIFRDETEKREAREALEVSRLELQAALESTEKARGEAEAATQAKDRFIAVLSHELRTPLTPVLLAAHALARRKDLPDAVREALAMIRTNIQLEAHLVDDLLDVTRIAEGKMELVIEPLDMHDVIQRAITITKADVEEKKQRLVVNFSATEHRLLGDAVRLQQVIWNLLKNASKFTPAEGAIHVTTSNSPGFFVIAVSDTGIGIELEALTRIFDPFAQANIGITREFGGLGLGLSISRAAVTAHGGELRAASAGHGTGSTFTVTLPLENEKNKVR